jgi:hypothetical protein
MTLLKNLKVRDILLKVKLNLEASLEKEGTDEEEAQE